MIQRKTIRILAETLIFSAAPAAANILIGSDPGFLSLRGFPVLAAGPLFAAFYGFRWGGAAAVLAAAAGFVGAPALMSADLLGAYAAAAADRLALSAAATLPAFFLLAFARFRVDHFREKILARFKLAVRRTVVLDRKIGALERVNRVLENRVSGQKDSITLLHNQVKKLVSLDLEHALATILETVELFTETSSAAIWRPDPTSGKLLPAAVRGWEEGGNRSAELDPDTTIEGYVIRNRKPFSARMVLDGAEFDRFDTSRSIIALPLIIKDKAWGALSIENLPFERYSLYTESILEILLGLAEPYLRAIVEYESLHALREVDEDTGYPEYSILYRTLEKDLERHSLEQGFISLVVVEMANFEEELGRHSRADLKRLLFRVKENLEETKGNRYRAFHFRNDNQIALLVDGLDRDGASFFCLDILTLCASIEPAAGEAPMPLEILVGFSTSDGKGGRAESMIETAEHLLSIQRL